MRRSAHEEGNASWAISVALTSISYIFSSIGLKSACGTNEKYSELLMAMRLLRLVLYHDIGNGALGPITITVTIAARPRCFISSIDYR